MMGNHLFHRQCLASILLGFVHKVELGGAGDGSAESSSSQPSFPADSFPATEIATQKSLAQLEASSLPAAEAGSDEAQKQNVKTKIELPCPPASLSYEQDPKSRAKKGRHSAVV